MRPLIRSASNRRIIRCVIVLGAVCASALATLAAPAGATWLSPVDLSPATGVNAQEVHVAMDRRGDAAAVWQASGGAETAVEVVDRRHLLSGRMPYTLTMASTTTKTRRIEIRITEEERNLEQAAAAASGETLSEFVRRAARREAERTLAERTRYLVDDESARRFLAALEKPSAVAERGLRELTTKPSVLRQA